MNFGFAFAFGIALVVIGAVMLIAGIGAPSLEVATEEFGRFGDSTRWDLLAGASLLAAGAALSIASLRR